MQSAASYDVESEKFRFEPIYADAEFAGDYVRGGFHPVHLDDVYHNRYRVLRKLGFGAFSTIWLARDQIENNYVALKIGSATSSHSGENDISQHLASLVSTHPGKAHVRTAQRTFVHLGPNGVHPCLVLEPLGRNFADLIVDHEPPNPESRFQTPPAPWPISFTRTVAKQLVMALDYLHSNHVMHRDIQPANIMLALTYDINSLSESEVLDDVRAKERELGESTIPLIRKDSLPLDPSKGDPLYLLGSTPLHDRLLLDIAPSPDTFRAILTDLGAASTFTSANDNQHKYPTRLRAPEVILHLPLSPQTDVFNLACVIFQIVTLHDLFILDELGSEQDEIDDENLMAMSQRLGPLPMELRKHWRRAEQWTDKEGRLLEERDPAFRPGTLQQDVSRLMKDKMTAEEADAFTDFLAMALRYDAQVRADTGTLLRHHWLTTEWDSVQK